MSTFESYETGYESGPFETQESYEDKVQYAAGFEPPETSTGAADETAPSDGE